MLSLDDLVEGARFLRRMPGFLRQSIQPEAARGLLRARLERREGDFLDIARTAIYAQEQSPYRRLLLHAGCEYGDVEGLVQQEGLEGALQHLYQRGVYLTIDEFRGRQPVVRGSLRFDVRPGLVRNPSAAPSIAFHSGGSRGAVTPMPLDLTHKWDRGVNACLTLTVRGGLLWHHAVWGEPGSSVMNDLLENSIIRARTVRWFSQVDPGMKDLPARYRWSVRALRWGSVLGGIPLPAPEYVSLENPRPIVQWMTSSLRHGHTPYLRTYPSSAVRICEAALANGDDLSGAQFHMSGEPFTPARLAAVRRVGATAASTYGSSESGVIGKSCLAPVSSDDLHFFNDLHAVIQPGEAGATTGLPFHALLLTSLRASSRFILLNVSMGDQGQLEERSCGCPMEELGWTTHLQEIRSFEKLSAGGMTFLDTDIVHVLEEALPDRFGGGPTDYQLIEEEEANGQPCLRLRVHPRLGPIPAEEIREAFLTAIAPGSGAERVKAQVWRDANFIQVEREAPQATSTGKILHLRATRQLAAARQADE